MAKPLTLILPIDVFNGLHGEHYRCTLTVWKVERGNGQIKTVECVSEDLLHQRSPVHQSKCEEV